MLSAVGGAPVRQEGAKVCRELLRGEPSAPGGGRRTRPTDPGGWEKSGYTESPGSAFDFYVVGLVPISIGFSV